MTLQGQTQREPRGPRARSPEATRLVAALRPQRRLSAPVVLHQRLELDSRVGRRGGVASVGGMGAWAVEAEVMVGVRAHHLVEAKAWSPLLARHANEPRAGSPQHTCGETC